MADLPTDEARRALADRIAAAIVIGRSWFELSTTEDINLVLASLRAKTDGGAGDQGAPATPSGSHPSDRTPSGSDPAGFDPSRMRWQPIATAPKDDEMILVCDQNLACGFHQVVYWDAQSKSPGWHWATTDGPTFHQSAFTHWMPLPEPPAQGIEARSDGTQSGPAVGESPVGQLSDAPDQSPHRTQDQNRGGEDA